MTKTSLIAAFALCAVTPLAAADSLADKKAHDAEQSRVTPNLKAANDACGARIAWAFDWTTWKAAADENGHHAAVSCGGALDALKDLCGTDKDTKATVAKQVKTIRCLGDGAEATVDFKAGVLTIHTGLESRGDVTQLTKQTLKDSLK